MRMMQPGSAIPGREGGDMHTERSEAASHCAYCGEQIADEPKSPERFGHRFCSQTHANEFVAGVRAARIEAAASRDEAATRSVASDGKHCALPGSGPRSWADYLKRAACWGAPVLLLLAIPLFWTGNAAAVTGGSILSVLGFLACPLGMYFMMRAMGNMSHGGQPARKGGADDPDPQGR